MALPSRTLQTSREQQRAGRQVKDGTRGALSFREREKRAGGQLRGSGEASLRRWCLNRAVKEEAIKSCF